MNERPNGDLMLLNYTTTVSADRTVVEVAAKLAQAGASQVLTEYHDGHPVGLAFAMRTASGTRQFRLPVEVSAVHGVLRSQRVAPRYQTKDHAERVAWRIIKDWVEAQLAIIETQMVAPDQVFLPYMLTAPDETLYDRYVAGLVPALGSGERNTT